MFDCCGGDVRLDETWFLYDNKSFDKRRVEIGFCYTCGKKVIAIFQTRIKDNFPFFEKTSRHRKINKILKEAKNDLYYKDIDYYYTQSGSKANMHWVSGLNFESIKNNIRHIKQVAIDFNNMRKTVKNEKYCLKA